MRAFPYLFAFVLMACSGSVAPSAGGEPSNAVVQQGGVLHNAAAPGMEEVLVGPHVVDPQDKTARSMSCAWTCEGEETTSSRVTARLQQEPVGNRLVRVVEYLFEEDVTRYQDLKTDSQGNFSFNISGPERREIFVYLIESSDEAAPLNKVLPCPEGACEQTEPGHQIGLFVAGQPSCAALQNANESSCKVPLRLPAGINILPSPKSGS